MNPNHLKKRQRTEAILSSIDKLDYLTRSQLQQLHDLGGDRNANRILNDLSEYLSSFQNGLEKVYYLNSAGRDFVLSDNVRQRTQNIDHYLLRNQLYIYLGRPATWENEVKIKLDNLTIIPDAMFTQRRLDVFIEVDLKQSMKQNADKIKRYKQLKEHSDRPFSVVFVTSLNSRRRKLDKLCGNLAHKVYTANEVR